MKKSIVIATGPPGTGKTVGLEELYRSFRADDIEAEWEHEYPILEEWSKLEDSKEKWLYPPEPGRAFDIRPEGYKPMSEYVGYQLAGKIDQSFCEGNSVVLFEFARGVGEPMVTYSDFIRIVLENLQLERNNLQLANVEFESDIGEIEERIRRRYDELERRALPPGAEKKYLRRDGTPLCYSTEDFEGADLGIPLVMNERVNNGRSEEALISHIESVVYPKVVERLGLPGVTVEGQLRGPEWM